MGAASSDQVARYLAAHAETLTANTLKQRLAALAQWHLKQGFPDPTKAPVVCKTFKGIRMLHPMAERQAKPLQIDQLRHVISWLDQAIEHSRERQNGGAKLRHTRDKSLLLLGV